MGHRGSHIRVNLASAHGFGAMGASVCATLSLYTQCTTHALRRTARDSPEQWLQGQREKALSRSCGSLSSCCSRGIQGTYNECPQNMCHTFQTGRTGWTSYRSLISDEVGSCIHCARRSSLCKKTIENNQWMLLSLPEELLFDSWMPLLVAVQVEEPQRGIM
jgi:hypothetical protein